MFAQLYAYTPLDTQVEAFPVHTVIGKHLVASGIVGVQFCFASQSDAQIRTGVDDKFHVVGDGPARGCPSKSVGR